MSTYKFIVTIVSLAILVAATGFSIYCGYPWLAFAFGLLVYACFEQACDDTDSSEANNE